MAFSQLRYYQTIGQLPDLGVCYKNKISGLIYGEGSTARKSSAWKNCSTPFEQMPKKMKLLEKPQKSHFKQMQVLEQNVNCSNCNCLTKTLKNVNCLNLKKLKVWNMYSSLLKKSWKVWNMYGSSVKKQSKLG